MAEEVRLIIEVVAGIIPGGTPEPEHTKTFVLTSREWHDTDTHARAALLAEVNGRAQGYAGWLMLQPDRFNWVRTSWVWL